MSEIIIGIYNHQTGEQETRPATAEEVESLHASQAQLAELNAVAESKANARQSALAKLVDLGLTEEEIAAL